MKKVLVLLFLAVFVWADAFDDGAAAANRGDWQEAIRQFTQAIKIDPNNRDAYLLRGASYDEFGDRSKAIADYTQAIKIDPNVGALAYYVRGNSYATLGDYSKAIADFTQAISINPSDAKTYNNRGVSYAKLRNFRQATQDARKACELGNCGLLQLLGKNGWISD
ncbi:hypothetical protein FACS1894103_3060 [Campylobacterota bacterium]|nr:hypothetical protein FACS1894103_3060 [Campylobacterota bacterium]